VAKKRVIVFGGDAAGVAAALEQAEAGMQVTLIEPSPSLGLELLPQTSIVDDDSPYLKADLDEVIRHPNIQIITNAEVIKTESSNGKYHFRIKRNTPRVDMDKCTDCKECIQVCPIHMYDDFNEGIGFRTAIDYFNPETAKAGDYNIFKEDMPICQATCPANLNIRSYAGLIADGKYAESLAVIRQRLPFALSIGRVCPHPCETACNRGYVDEPIAICALKRFVADYEMHNSIEPPVEVPDEFHPEKVAIIGAGPAGLSCAFYLAKAGYHSVVFEAMPEPGGMFRYGIPEYRLPTETLMHEINWILAHGVELRCNARIGEDVSFQDLRRDYAAVFIGVRFLRDVNMGNKIDMKGRVIIIGGGNVAMDAARVSWREGFDEVHVVYRRTRKEMPASPWEIDAAEDEGVKFQFLVSPVEVIGDNGRMTGLKCLKMELGEPDASGRRRPVPIEGSDFVIEAENLIAAIGQRPDIRFVPDESELEITRWNTFAVDQESFQTNVPGIFSAGDVETGPDIAIRACANGRKAALGIARYIEAKRREAA